jgi:Ca2+-binding EF-hand superfamily protein
MKRSSSREEQQKRLEMSFDIFDINDDGRIDAKELNTLFVALGEMDGKQAEDSKAKARDVLARYDVSNNKSLDKFEFTDACLHEKVFAQFH